MKKVLAVGSITAMVLLNSCGGGSTYSGGFDTVEGETSGTLFPYLGSSPISTPNHLEDEQAQQHFKDSIESGSQIEEEPATSCASIMVQNSWMEKTTCTSGENYSRIWTFESDKTFYNDSYRYPNPTWECLNDELILSFSSDDGVSIYRLPYQGDMSFAYTSNNCVTTMKVTQNTSNESSECDPLSELMGICNTTTEPTTSPSTTPSTVPTTTSPANNAPIVDAGDDKSVVINRTITLKGVAIDAEGDIMTYEWSENSSVLSTSASFEYTPSIEGVHTLRVKVCTPSMLGVYSKEALVESTEL
ncbi:MAG: hypothetical protein U9N49_09685, partial [Campylobacterota bacterium]|nr:hypothetical protein [Campylobacterota bacterium]